MKIFTERGLQKELIRRQEEQEEAKYRHTQWYELRDDIFHILGKLDLLEMYIENMTKKPVAHDGCEGCKHVSKDDGEYPCSSCKQNYLDRYEREQ